MIFGGYNQMDRSPLTHIQQRQRASQRRIDKWQWHIDDITRRLPTMPNPAAREAMRKTLAALEGTIAGERRLMARVAARAQEEAA